MVCLTPNISATNVSLPFELSRDNFGFILDGVQNFTSLEDLPGVQRFEFLPDPVYFQVPRARPHQETVLRPAQAANHSGESKHFSNFLSQSSALYLMSLELALSELCDKISDLTNIQILTTFWGIVSNHKSTVILNTMHDFETTTGI